MRTLHYTALLSSSFAIFDQRLCTNAFCISSTAIGKRMRPHITSKTLSRRSSTSPQIGIDPNLAPFESSEVELHVGNINWHVTKEDVVCYFKELATRYDLQLDSIDVKPASSKPRDKGKCHGGSTRLRFASKSQATFAMKILNDGITLEALTPSQSYNHTTCIDEVKPIGDIHVRWAINNRQDKKQQHQTPPSEEISIERILHRQRRAEKYARQRKTVARKTDEAIDRVLSQLPLEDQNIDNIPTLDVPPLDWSENGLIDPCHGGGLTTGSERGMRKRAQVETFLYILKVILGNTHLSADDSTSSVRKNIADLGSGSGNLSLPLSYFMRKEKMEYGVLAVDINPRALQRLSSRARDATLDIETKVEDLFNLCQESRGRQHIGERYMTSSCLDHSCAIVSLHACGAASDLAIVAAVQQSVPFVVSPCCIGKVKTVRQPNQMPSIASQRSATPDIISYPRSKTVADVISKEDYSLILTAADYSVPRNLEKSAVASSEANQKELIQERRGKLAKTIVEMDRLKWAQERGYSTRIMEIPRLGRFYPKRQVLIGSPANTLAATNMEKLKQRSLSTQLFATNNDEDNEGRDKMQNFDENMTGLAKYLIPYAIAFFASVGVTVAFVKFVLMDY